MIIFLFKKFLLACTYTALWRHHTDSYFGYSWKEAHLEREEKMLRWWWRWREREGKSQKLRWNMYMRMKSFLLISSNIFHRFSLFAQRKPVRFYIACVSILNDVSTMLVLCGGSSITLVGPAFRSHSSLDADSHFPVTLLSARSTELFSLSHLSKTLLTRVHGVVLDCVGYKSFRFLRSPQTKREKDFLHY